MGCWGMGVTQSDEYCEVYERFMEQYDTGKPVPEITKDILKEYLAEFSESDGILHDVYFALGKAEWMCGGISRDIFDRIVQILENGENLEFLRELEASEKDLKARKKNLDEFLRVLSTPRPKAKKRKIPEEKYVPKPEKEYAPLPQLQAGDVLAYNKDGVLRVFSVVRHERAYGKTVVFCYLWKKRFCSVPELEQLLKEHIMPLGYLDGDTFPDINKVVNVGNLPELKKLGRIPYTNLLQKEWNRYVFLLSLPDTPVQEYDIEHCLVLEDALKRAESWLQKDI